MHFPSLILVSSTLFAPSLAAPSGLANYLSLGGIRARTDPYQTPKKPTINPSDSSAANSPPYIGMTSFNMDSHMREWLGSTQQKLSYAAYTDGGWESWAQYEIEFFLKSTLGLDVTRRIREVQVYGDKKAADFTFDPSQQKNTKGMVVELKCENHNSEGAAFIASVGKDIQKLRGQLAVKYQDYDRVALAMAYSAEAQNALGKLGMSVVGGTEVPLPFGSGKILKMYRWDEEEDTGAACNVNPFNPRDGTAHSGCSATTQASSMATSTKSTSQTAAPAKGAATSKQPAHATTASEELTSVKATTTPKVAASTKATTSSKVTGTPKAATTPKAKTSPKKST